MPTIPLYNFTPTATPQANVRAPGDIYAGVGQAGRNVGSAIASLGDPIMAFRQKAQQHIDEGNLSAEETERLKAAADIEAYVQNPNNPPEKWAAEFDRRRSAYDAERAKRVTGFSRRAQEKDTINAKEYFDRMRIDLFGGDGTGGLALKAAIIRANGAKEANANARLLQGDYLGAFEQYRSMDMTDEQKALKIQVAADTGLRDEYQRRILDVRELPPAQRVPALAGIRKELAGDGGVIRDDAGNAIAGLERQTRNQLLAGLGEHENQAQNEIWRTIGGLFRTYGVNGSATLFNARAAEAKKAGAVSVDLYVGADPESGLPTFRGSAVGDFSSDELRYAEDEASIALTKVAVEQEKDAQAAQVKARKEAARQAQTAQGLVPEAQAGRLSVEQINRRVKDGDIDEVQGGELRRVVERGAAQDLNPGNKLTIATNVKDADGNTLTDVRQAILDYRDAAELAARDVAEIAAYGAKKLDDVTAGERQAWLASVNKLPIGLEAKAILMEKYLAAYEVDLVGFDVKSKNLPPGVWDLAGIVQETTRRVTHLDGRELTQAEVDARVMIAKAWRMAPGLGEDWSGELLLQQERALTDFFTSDKYDPQDKAIVDKGYRMAEDMAREVADVSAQRLLEQSIPLGILAR